MKSAKLILIAFCFFLVRCNSNTTESKNHPPKIVSVTATPSTIEIARITETNYMHAHTKLSIVATDEDRDQLSYSWSSEYGSMYDVTKPNSTWNTDGLGPGDYIVSCIVSDGIEVASGSITIWVKLK